MAARPSRATLERLAAILEGLLMGSHIERVWRPGPTSLLIDFRALGKRRLYASLGTRHPWIAVTTRWPETPAAPDRETLMLRKCLEGARVTAVMVEDARRLVIELAPRAEHEPVLAIQLAGRYANAAVFDRGAELVKLIGERPGIDPDSPPLTEGPAALPEIGEDERWLDALADGYWAAEDQRQLETRRAALTKEARVVLQRKQRALDALRRDLEKARGAEDLRREAELLKASLYQVEPGMTAIEVPDWDAVAASGEAPTVVIALDPTLTPAENLQRRFARYKKLTRAEAAIAQRIGAAEQEVARFTALVAGLALTSELDPLERELRALGVRPPALPKSASDAPERLPYRRFRAADGTEILVGKSARDNDDLTFHVARGADLFLHARDIAGSHVILRASRGGPSSEALIDAASLAAWGSKLRDEGVVDVLYTERKHVRKPRGAAPGLVQVASARTLTVRLDPERIKRLYDTLDPHARES